MKHSCQLGVSTPRCRWWVEHYMTSMSNSVMGRKWILWQKSWSSLHVLLFWFININSRDPKPPCDTLSFYMTSTKSGWNVINHPLVKFRRVLQMVDIISVAHILNSICLLFMQKSIHALGKWGTGVKDDQGSAPYIQSTIDWLSRV